MPDTNFQKTTLDNGLRVLTERLPHLYAVSLGICVRAGSLFESGRERGLAHLLEHMVFKGTRRRSMKQIAAGMDLLGGGMNAFTEREFVCFHVKVLAEHVKPALALLCDLVTEPTLDGEMLQVEKGVIIEEIRAIEDTPEELLEDLFTETLWGRSRWGRPITGTVSSVEKLTAADLSGFMARYYSPQNVLVTAVGNLDHQQLVHDAQSALEKLPGDRAHRVRAPREPNVQAHHVMRREDTEGAHLIIGTRAYNYNNPRRFAAWILEAIMTGGYSSRLFQEVREKRGLCYSISGLTACYEKAGYWAVETSVAVENAAKTADLIGRELRKVKKNGVTHAELARAKEMTRVNIVLAEESSSSRLARLARHELYFGRQKSMEESLAEIAGVTQEAVHEVANDLFDPRWMNFTAIGPFEGKNEPAPIDVS
jgi:predicted Zn-dependent peptidase